VGALAYRPVWRERRPGPTTQGRAYVESAVALDDRKVAEALYAASHAGVQIDLIVRGVCTIRPGVPGLSKNVRVRSVIGRFLEHSRIFYYRNCAADPADGEFYIGSADWMHRNLTARVEAVTPITQSPLRNRLWGLLQTMLADRRQAWVMGANGDYHRPAYDAGSAESGTHQVLMDLTAQEAALSPEELRLLK
jgi:polyphosphate kinase